LKGRGNTLHVRIDADPAFRIQSLVAQGKAPDLDAARQAILQSDRDRAALIRKISGLDWNDPRNFDLLVDMSSCGPEICAERIASAAESRFEVCRPTGRRGGRCGLATLNSQLKKTGIPRERDQRHFATGLRIRHPGSPPGRPDRDP
jgi:hypothetical protein